uniref:FAD-dependent oxidoreductase n=1 Tax=candidate division WOR-3 bacterium TaxID=2052148 RepID=A0A7C3YNX8_UNCW3
MYDVLIVGGGPAGMTAGLYAGRKNLKTILISQDLGGQALWTLTVENFMGYLSISGPDLMAKFQRQISSSGIRIRVPDEAVELKKESALFVIKTKFGGEYRGKTVIVATGKRPKRLDVPGEKELTGRGVSYCVTCDAPLFANKSVAVIGGGNSAVSAALDLSKLASKVYLVARSALKADPILIEKLGKEEKVTVLLGFLPKEILGKERVVGIVVIDQKKGEEKEISLDGVFVEVGLVPNTDFLKGLLAVNELGEIIVNCNCETSEEGVFACGDVTNVSGKQIIIACGEGAKAALAAYRYLLKR